MKSRGLSPKQQRFVDEYLVDSNATQAAIRAGYSAKTAEQQGSRLLRNVQVAAAIEERGAKLAKKVGTTAERVRRGLWRNYKRSMRAPVKDGGSVANKALELLGKDVGMFKDRLDVNVSAEKATTEQLLALLPQALSVLNTKK